MKKSVYFCTLAMITLGIGTAYAGTLDDVRPGASSNAA